MKKSGYFNRNSYRIVFFLFYLMALRLNADSTHTSFVIGETFRYTINIYGIKVGTQIIKLVSEEDFNGSSVYKIRGITKTTGISRLFHQYSEQWTLLIDSTTLCPVWIERHIEDGGVSSDYTYSIDQAQHKVVVFNREKGEKKVIHTNNIVFDQYLVSLFYFYRENPFYFKGDFSFDFLKKDYVKTALLQQVGPVQVCIPKLSRNDKTTTCKFSEKGGDGIEIYAGMNGFAVPLKIVFSVPLKNNKKSTKIELYIRDYAVNIEEELIPESYRPLFNRGLLVINVL
ncbi:MAG: hypothetical protein AMS17_02455 [Spirochaetes bacterium DG_61]|nr:MAG: hypothetical protein AMS17_02455 [Spirochaetes bacterium DG_61]